MEASKATADHIKQVESDHKVAQINLMRHQCTDLLPSKHKKKLSSPVSNWSGTVPKLMRSKEHILHVYADVFDGIACFPGSPYHIHIDPSVTCKQTPCQPVPVHLKEPFKQEIDKMLQAGILKPVHQATPWINNFVIVEGKDKFGKLKLRICLEPTNLNKAIVHEPYHFKTPEHIAHLLADACVIIVNDCRKGFWHQQLDEASSFLTMFNTGLGRFYYTIMPFGATVVGDVFCSSASYMNVLARLNKSA